MWTIEEKEHATKTRRDLERLADAAETYCGRIGGTERKQERGRSMNEFSALIDWLKTIADKSNAGRAYVDFLQDDGALIRIEYKPAKRKEATK